MWNYNDPGDNPVCTVGAGFQLGVLDPCLPTTKSIIQETVSTFGNEFPALARVEARLPNRDLNFVWTNISSIAAAWQSLTPEITKAYEARPNTPMQLLVEDLKKRSKSASWLLWVILGVELKRMLALQYDQTKLKLKDSLPQGLLAFLATKTGSVTWISLNYELCLENVLQQYGAPGRWQYGFENLLEGRNTVSPSDIRHVIVKPHGSLNIWFTTVWQGRRGSGKPDLHQVSFVNPADRLKTCSFTETGYIPGTEPPEEKRPWVIGYLPDIMKDEINSPGQYADNAHDLCKWNLSYAGLALQKASALYILAYSMPPEDRWIWERLAALTKKDLPIYVASGSDTARITEALRSRGFTNAQWLSPDGLI